MMSSAQIQKHLLPSNINSLAMVEQIIEDIKNLHGIPEELYGNILVSITEAANNALKHGNKMNSDLNIEFSYEYSDDEIKFTIKDQGIGFDRSLIEDPTHPDNLEKPDGRGIFIMESLSDEVEFMEGGSIVCLKFKR